MAGRFEKSERERVHGEREGKGARARNWRKKMKCERNCKINVQNGNKNAAESVGKEGSRYGNTCTLCEEKHIESWELH